MLSAHNQTNLQALGDLRQRINYLFNELDVLLDEQSHTIATYGCWLEQRLLQVGSPQIAAKPSTTPYLDENYL